MNQTTEPHSRNKPKSTAWVVSVAIFIVIYLILQQQKQEREPEDSGKSPAVTVAADGTSQAPEQTDTDLGPLSTSDRNQKVPKSQAIPTELKQTSAKRSVQTPASSNRPPPTESDSTSQGTTPALGQIRKTGHQTWESTAGLIYGPGSQEKHRIKHVMRHATDQPRRPGKHGVFAGNGDQEKVLALIDEAYLKALQGGKSVQKKQEGQRTVYTIDMHRPVGYVGGQVGNQLGKPPARKIRLVLEGTSVITAFPL